MTNIISIRLANGNEREWRVSVPSQEQIDLLPVVLNALDRHNDSLVVEVTPETVTDLAQTTDEDITDQELLERLIASLCDDDSINAVVTYGEHSDIAYFGEGEFAVSIQSGVAIPVFPSEMAEEKLEELDRWGLSEDIVVVVNGRSFQIPTPVRDIIDQFGDFEDVYSEVFEDYAEEWLVEGYTYDTDGFVVREFTRGLSVSDFTKSE